MDKIMHRVRNITLLVLLISGFLMVCLEFIKADFGDTSDHYYKLNKNWTVSVSGNIYRDVDLSKFVPVQQNSRAVLELNTRIPEEVDIENPVLKIYTIHSGYDVFLDCELLEHYGLWETARHEVVGTGYGFIDLPKDYAGRNLRIRLYVNEDNAFTDIVPPQIYNNKYMIRDLVRTNILPLTINLFLLFFGIFAFLMGAIYNINSGRFSKLIYIAIFAILISLWSMCNYDLVTLFTYNKKVKAYMEYITLYSCPIFTLLYFKQDIIDAPKWIKHFMNFTMVLQSGYIILCAFLAITNIKHLPEMLLGEHIIMLFICANTIIDLVYSIKKTKQNKKILITGLGLFIFVAIFDIVRFDLQKYYYTDKVFSYVSWICVGLLFFIIAQTIDFCQDMSRNYTVKMKEQTLNEMAYLDPLTQIGNRRKCDEEFKKLDKTNAVYGMISFDLNNLKKVNDNEGHEKGDLLIRSFAEVLKTTYEKYGVVCRMGGDEFIVVFPSLKNVDIDKLDKQLHANIDKKNKEIPDLNISTAYGFSDNRNNHEWKSADIYRDADRKMYENKIAMKAQRV